MKPPFGMIVQTKIEAYRYETFWVKEPETLAWINSFSDGDVLYDVGANIGLYSLYCAAVHPSCIACAFEPHEKNFNRLLDNVMLNNYGDRVKCHRFIIAEDSGKRDFIESSPKIGSSGGQMVDPGEECHTSCRSIDSLVYFTFNFPSPTHVKIDIDGQELKVIQGMKQVLKEKTLKSVLVEVDVINNYNDIRAIFNNNGFTMDNKFNVLPNHSRQWRKKVSPNVENVIFTR